MPSMLAEPRQKQRISIDPQNLGWAGDESRVGKQMMEKMGWRGGGLGRKEEGMRENLKLKANRTQKGLGLNKSGTKADGQWMVHHDDFAQLLAQLNEKKKQQKEAPLEEEEAEAEESIAETAEAPSASASIEERSRQSRTRIHYHRYVRSKDVSALTVEQKAAIFGGGANTKNDGNKIGEANMDESKQKVKKSKKAPKEEATTAQEDKLNNLGNEPPIETAKNIKTAALTMDQYFAKKMAEMAKKKKRVMEEAPFVAADANQEDENEKTTTKIEEDDETDDETKAKRMRKKQRKMMRMRMNLDDERSEEEGEEFRERKLKKKQKNLLEEEVSKEDEEMGEEDEEERIIVEKGKKKMKSRITF